jgi:hypothetical protein
MYIHQLIVLPDDQTLNYLRQIFSACPFDLDFDQMHVEVNSSVQEMEADTSRVHVAESMSMNIWYDSASQSTSLLLPLNSPELLTRCAELRTTAPSEFYGAHYFPFLMIKRHMPPMARQYRAFINSVSDTLFAKRTPLVFDSEFVMSKSFDYVPDVDFYKSQIAVNL